MGNAMAVNSVGGFSLISFMTRHWYLIIILLIALPMIISTINQTIQEKNPAIPITKYGIKIINADASLYDTVETLKTNPQTVIGMDYPTIGIFNKFKYYWKFFFNVIWEIFGTIFLITLPFITIYKIRSMQDTTSPSKNMTFALIITLVYITFVNLLLIVHGLIWGDLVLNPPPSDFFQELWWTIKLVLPFHGVADLVAYIISLF